MSTKGPLHRNFRATFGLSRPYRNFRKSFRKSLAEANIPALFEAGSGDRQKERKKEDRQTVYRVIGDR